MVAAIVRDERTATVAVTRCMISISMYAGDDSPGRKISLQYFTSGDQEEHSIN
jgi:hypothetical protein